MTTEEFSNEFDILYNNISSNAAPGLNEYEKSVLLTKAQLEIVRNYFTPKGNKYQEGFDESPKRQIDFSHLIKVIKPNQVDTLLNGYEKFDDRSILYDMPKDVLYVLNETATVLYDGKYRNKINIMPITFDEYNFFNSRPYRQPYKHHGWRLINMPDNGSSCIAEVIVKEGAELEGYTIRYVRMPQPIILIDLKSESDIDGEEFMDLSIQGRNVRTECELDKSIHNEILQRAVEIAKSTYTGDINSIIQLGTRSE